MSPLAWFQNSHLKRLLLAVIAFYSVVSIAPAFAASQSFTGKLNHVRVEHLYGFIAVKGVLPFAQEYGCSTSRLYVDLRDEIGKIQYNTALAAVMANKTISIRAKEGPSGHVFGACKLHDIIVYNE